MKKDKSIKLINSVLKLGIKRGINGENIEEFSNIFSKIKDEGNIQKE